MTSRTYEQKKALVEKWFTKEQLAEFEKIKGQKVLVKSRNTNSSSLEPSITRSLPEIANEKENMMEQVGEYLRSHTINSFIFQLLDIVDDQIMNSLCDDGDRIPDNISLTRPEIQKIVDNNYDLIGLIKLLISLNYSSEKIEFFERRIDLAKAGVSDY